MSRIFWTYDEQESVATEWVNILQRAPGMERLECCRMAQQVLPAARRRNIIGANNLPAVLLRLVEEKKKAAATAAPAPQRQEAEAPPPSTPPNVTQQAEDFCVRVLVRVFEQIIHNPIVIAYMNGKSANGALDLSQRIAPPKYDPEPKGEQRERKRVILICGGIAQKQVDRTHIEAAFPEFHFKFWHDEHAGYDMLKAKAGGAWRAIVFTLGCGHDAKQILDKMGIPNMLLSTNSRLAVDQLLETYRKQAAELTHA